MSSSDSSILMGADSAPQPANAVQHGGDHYKGLAIQPWDYIDQNNIPFLEGCAIKYITRWRDKGRVGDLRKAIHCLEKRIEMEGRK